MENMGSKVRYEVELNAACQLWFSLRSMALYSLVSEDAGILIVCKVKKPQAPLHLLPHKANEYLSFCI